MSFYVAGDEENLPRLEKLRVISGGESSLVPFLRGFQDGGFVAEKQQFVTERAHAFKAVCIDGSHPLEWTQYHREYRDMYERHFNRILECVSMSRDEVHEYFAWLHQNAKFLDDDSEDLYTFLDALTSSEDYQEFLQVMFAEVRKQQNPEKPGYDVVWRRIEIEEVEDIEVIVPFGVVAGQVLPIHYMGLPYKVTVPEGYFPGMAFTTEITLHKNCSEVYLCAYCGARFDRATSGRIVSKCKRCYERCDRDVCYCGVECQKADWPQHRITCGKFVVILAD